MRSAIYILPDTTTPSGFAHQHDTIGGNGSAITCGEHLAEDAPTANRTTFDTVARDDPVPRGKESVHFDLLQSESTGQSNTLTLPAVPLTNNRFRSSAEMGNHVVDCTGEHEYTFAQTCSTQTGSCSKPKSSDSEQSLVEVLSTTTNSFSELLPVLKQDTKPIVDNSTTCLSHSQSATGTTIVPETSDIDVRPKMFHSPSNNKSDPDLNNHSSTQNPVTNTDFGNNLIVSESDSLG